MLLRFQFFFGAGSMYNFLHRRSNLIKFSFCTTSGLVSGVYRFSLVSTWAWAWTFYAFIHSFFSSLLLSIPNETFILLQRCWVFFLLIHWLYCRWWQLSPFRKCHNIHIAFTHLIQGDFILRGILYHPVAMRTVRGANSEWFPTNFLSFKMYWFKIHIGLLLLADFIVCLGVCAIFVIAINGVPSYTTHLQTYTHAYTPN